MKVYTNKHKRQFKYRNEVPNDVLQDDFDWLDDDSSYDGFIHYRGNWYHVSEFMRCDDNSPFNGWHGYHSDSFFSGILIRLSDDCETYQIGTYIA